MVDNPLQVEVTEIRGGTVFGSATAARGLVLANDDGVLAQASFTAPDGAAPFAFTIPIPAEVISQGTVTLFIRADGDRTNLAQVLLSVGESTPGSIDARLHALETEMLQIKAAMRREFRNR